MAMQYAPSTGCFYPDDIEYPEDTIPADAVQTTLEVFDAWCASAPGSTIAFAGGEIVIHAPAPPTLEQVKAARIGELTAQYQTAATAPLEFETAAGTTARFTRDAAHKAMVDNAVSAGASAWTAEIWIDDGNTPVMPFAFADLEGLQAALAAPSAPSLTDLLTRVASVSAASDTASVAAVTF